MLLARNAAAQSRMPSGAVISAPSAPRPPALATAAASGAGLALAIGAWRMGARRPKRAQKAWARSRAAVGGGRHCISPDRGAPTLARPELRAQPGPPARTFRRGADARPRRARPRRATPGRAPRPRRSPAPPGSRPCARRGAARGGGCRPAFAAKRVGGRACRSRALRRVLGPREHVHRREVRVRRQVLQPGEGGGRDVQLLAQRAATRPWCAPRAISATRGVDRADVGVARRRRRPCRAAPPAPAGPAAAKKARQCAPV